MNGGQLLAVSNTFSKRAIHNSAACYVKEHSEMEVFAGYGFPF